MNLKMAIWMRAPDLCESCRPAVTRVRRSCLAAAVCLLLVLNADGLFAAAPRFSAQMLNGQRIDGGEVHDWHDVNAKPRLESTLLFDPANPVRWLQDNTLPVSEMPAAYVEFWGGDLLPGRVRSSLAGNEQAYWKQPSQLLVEPLIRTDWPDALRPAGIGVQTKWLKRVVWERREDARFRPGTLYTRDGRQVEFRSVRWVPGAVRLLVDQDTREFTYGEIAELHLPQVEPWSAWFEQLSLLVSGQEPGLPVMQMETSDGARVTTSTARLMPLSRGGGNPDHWYQAVQPAWAMEPIYLVYRTIRVRRFFKPNEIPLTAIEPTVTKQQTTLSAGWLPRGDRSVRGTGLACGEQLFGWGIGVHGATLLQFELPALPGSFRTSFGLDKLAGPGGCVRAAIHFGAVTDPAVFQSKVITGTGDLVETPELTWPAGGPKLLTLNVDAMFNDRPAGADPFEIRDLADWLHPVVTVDLEQLKLLLANQIPRQIAAWDGWKLLNADSAPADLQPTWETSPVPGWRFRPDLKPRNRLFTLARTLSFPATAKWLMISAVRFERDTAPSRIQVSIGGRVQAEFDVPIRYGWQEAKPLLVPVESFAGQSLPVEITQFSDDPKSVVEWRAIQLVDRDPVLAVLFDEQSRFIDELSQGDALALLETTDKYFGQVSIKLTPGERENPQIPGWNFAIRSVPRLGEYRYLRFAWKKVAGRSMGLHLAKDGRFPAELVRDARMSLRYHVGSAGRKEYGNGIQLKDQPGKDWEIVNRDLFGDFGEFSLTGLRLTCPDGEGVLFDEILLARHPEDFQAYDQMKKAVVNPLAALPEPVRNNTLRMSNLPAEFPALVSEILPQFSTLESSNGVFILKEYKGRPNILQTHPPAPSKPSIFRAAVSIPKDKKTVLHAIVSHHQDADWQLIVKVDGETQHDSLIKADTAPDGWADLKIDLSKFAGRRIALEVHQHPNNWANEFAYWQRLAIETE